MKASELIIELTKVMPTEGDLDVGFYDNESGGYDLVGDVRTRPWGHQGTHDSLHLSSPYFGIS